MLNKHFVAPKGLDCYFTLKEKKKEGLSVGCHDNNLNMLEFLNNRENMMMMNNDG